MPCNASSSAMPLLVGIVLALLASPAAAFNITRILGEFSDFSTFNHLLTQTKLADEINQRQTITVLALDNGAAGGISSLPSDVQKKVLSVHVVLDYYDTDKLGGMKNRSAVLTTLFQSSGQATNRMGFLNYTKRSDGVMVFGSAEPGAQVTSQMVKVVVTRPYNISVLQVSSPIVPPGISSGNNSKAGAPPPHPAKSNAPAPSPSKSKGKKGASSPKSDASAPAPSDEDDDSSADAPGPAADGPTADGPAADGPTADGPAEADAPAHAADDAADAPSAAGRAVASAGLGIVALLVVIFSVSL
uniref:FAS1 domain-containing protein n=1 Tax=Oryza punctata TaxID=4537 RepID=A0A0E0JZK2_ORYPU